MGSNSDRRPDSMLYREPTCERERQLNEFDQTKMGVIGLLETGITRIPEIFIIPPEGQPKPSDAIAVANKFHVPIIDLQGFANERHKGIVEEISQASRTWGIFYVVNHGVPLDVMNKMLDVTRQFYEQPKESRMKFYSRDPAKKVRYYTSISPAYQTALWKETMICDLDDNASTTELPTICRETINDYANHMTRVKDKLARMLSKALGLSSDYLHRTECIESPKVVVHYYPACPEPELTLGTPRHSDPFFLTILLTSAVDGLQVLHQNQWTNVPPMEGALIVIIGDMLQLISNNIFTSPEHRVLAQKVGPRMASACFFNPSSKNKERRYGVIDELVSEKNPSLYRETSLVDYYKVYQSNRDSKSLTHFMNNQPFQQN